MEVENYTKISKLDQVQSAPAESLFMMSIKNSQEEYSSVAMEIGTLSSQMKNTIVDEVKAASESYDLIAKSQTLSDILNGEGGAIVLASAAKELYLAAQGEQPSYTDYLSKTTTSQQTVAGSVQFVQQISCQSPATTSNENAVVNCKLLNDTINGIAIPAINGFDDTLVSSLTVSNTATRTILVGVPDSAILNIKVYTPIPTNIEIDVFCNSHVVVPAASIAAYMEVAREHVDDADSGLWRPLEMKKLAGYEINTLVIPCQKFTILRFRDIKTIPRGISDSEILTAATETFPKNMKIQVNQYRSE